MGSIYHISQGTIDPMLVWDIPLDRYLIMTTKVSTEVIFCGPLGFIIKSDGQIQSNELTDPYCN